MAVIKHATFETDLDGFSVWYGSTIERDDSDPIVGSWSLRVTGAGIVWTNEYYGSQVPVSGGNDYDFSVQYGDAIAGMSWDIEWKNSSGSVIRTDTIDMPQSAAVAQATGTFTAPEGSGEPGNAWWASGAELKFNVNDCQLDDILIQDAAGAEEIRSFTASFGLTVEPSAGQSKSVGTGASLGLGVSASTGQSPTAELSASEAIAAALGATTAKGVDLNASPADVRVDSTAGTAKAVQLSSSPVLAVTASTGLSKTASVTTALNVFTDLVATLTAEDVVAFTASLGVAVDAQAQAAKTADLSASAGLTIEALAEVGKTVGLDAAAVLNLALSTGVAKAAPLSARPDVTVTLDAAAFIKGSVGRPVPGPTNVEIATRFGTVVVAVRFGTVDAETGGVVLVTERSGSVDAETGDGMVVISGQAVSVDLET